MIGFRLVLLIGLLAPGGLLLPGATARAQGADRRLALVIGESAYAAAPLRASANDAGMIAQSLAAAGFEVTGYADLDGLAIRKAMADFAAEARQAGPEAVAFVYLAGYGVQFGGANFLVPIEATLARDVDVPREAVPLADLMQALAAIPLKARIVVCDLAKAHPFARTGSPLASGLALVEPAPGLLVAANTAPGAVAVAGAGPYDLYAQALTEMMQVKGLPIEDMFARTRARVTALSGGDSVPWNDGTLERPFALFPPVPDTTASATLALKPGGPLSAEDGFWAAILRDTLQAYAAFVKTYPDDASLSRVRALLAVRREALTFAQAVQANVAPAYWTYMRRYPRGPHFADIRRRLAALPAALEPPPRFDLTAFADLPPPARDELFALEQPVMRFDDPAFASVQAPSSQVVPARRAGFYERWPPLLAVATHALPLPLPIPLGFAFPAGRIVQPDLGGHPGPAVATTDLDKSGSPILTQTGPDGRILTAAIVATGPDGVTLTQTGPDGHVVSTIKETIAASGTRIVTQTGPAGRVIRIDSALVEPNGNRVVTSSDGSQEVTITTTTPNGMIVKPHGLPPPPPSRDAVPVVLPRLVPVAPKNAVTASPPDGPAPNVAPAKALEPEAPVAKDAEPVGKPLVAPVAPKAVVMPLAPVMIPIIPPAVPEPRVPEPRVPEPKVPDVTIPDVRIPDVRIPGLTVSEPKAPEIAPSAGTLAPPAAPAIMPAPMRAKPEVVTAKDKTPELALPTPPQRPKAEPAKPSRAAPAKKAPAVKAAPRKR